MDDKAKLRELYRKKEKVVNENALDYYDPYPFQVDFHNDAAPSKALEAGNQIGKTVGGTVEDAMDLTGKYPDWFTGRRYDRPISLVCGGVNNDKTRDLLQKALFGDPVTWEASLGTGWLPKGDIGKISKKRGVSDAFLHVKIRHYTDGKFDGWSTVSFQSYESGKAAWMGDTIDIFHLDEEPPMDILEQAGRGCIASGGRIRCTYTPENGQTEVVRKIKKEWSLHKAGWPDVAGEDFSVMVEGEPIEFTTKYTLNGNKGHLTEEKVLNAAKNFAPYQLKMRMRGIPVLGSGLVFAYSEEQIKCKQMSFPAHFLFLDAMDFGGLSSTAHPTAFARMAYDPDNDVIYIYDGFRMTGKEIPEIAAHIIMKTNSDVIPVAYPHDGNRITGQGESTRDQYANAGVNMCEVHVTNPPADHQEEGKGGIQIMPGITDISARMADGRFLVMDTVHDFWEEFRSYHMKDGKIVDVDDDFMSAIRYAAMFKREAVSLIHKTIVFNQSSGASRGWMSG